MDLMYAEISEIQFVTVAIVQVPVVVLSRGGGQHAASVWHIGQLTQCCPHTSARWRAPSRGWSARRRSGPQTS